MKVYKSLEELSSDQERGIALGVFDGLHLGHRHILQELILVCKEKSLRPAVFTFLSPFGPEENQRLIESEEKYAVLEALGIEDVFVADMTDEFRSISALEFLQDLLQKKLNVKTIVVGEDARFGAGAQGDINFLADYAGKSDLTYKISSDVLFRGEKISSSRIRNCLAQGELEAVTAMLTQPYRLRGVVEHGRRIGSRKGFPTANFPYPPKRARLHKGVYATVAHCDRGAYPAISNVGVSPTIEEETPLRVESYLYDFEDSLYGEIIEVEFLSFIRPELTFDTVEDLAKVVREDLVNVAKWHRSHMVK
ncbi:MAG: riboflavin biosynthesis protein RibF [Clostridiaceae bacterium]|jgi:riboflavin kinase/FMN adenylyltransferase|nr:riboflavin biosynthesis protein RibF [Clostridiaceae bacterium]